MRLKPRKAKSLVVRQWMADNQGKHPCGCGCGEFVVIQLHHYTRGVPSFINGHGSRVKNGMIGRTGEKNPNYKGGRYVGRDVRVLIPRQRPFNYVLEHRLVMQRALGRELKDSEVVHHKNGIKTDNRIENLELMTVAEHSEHHAGRQEIGFGHHRNWGHKRAADR